MHIWQAFKFNLEVEQNDAFWASIRSAGAEWETFLHSLKTQGFSVLIGDSTIGSIPTNIILGVSAENYVCWRTIKEVFYEFTNKHHLPFRSGSSYREAL